MKKGLFLLIFSTIFIVVPKFKKGYSNNIKSENANIENVENIKSLIDNNNEAVRLEKREEAITKFLNKLSIKESSGNWKAINRYGYIGKYQFGGAALKDLGVYSTINANKFRQNPWIFPPDLQDTLAIKLMHINKRYLKKHLAKYRNRKINGILINDASVLAAAHLVGMGNMRRFFESNGKLVARDGNGIAATSYMKAFQDIEFIL